MNHIPIIWDDKYKGRIAIYDYYLPVMGLVAMGLGKKTAEIDRRRPAAIRDTLFKMKAVSKLVGDVVASQTALATGEVDILVGGGEWVTAGLQKDNPAMDFVLPEEGGVRWSQAIGIFAASQRKDAALKFVQYIVSPEGQARLATSACYWAMPTNTQAAAERRAEEDPALGRPGEVYCQFAALSRAVGRARRQDAGSLDRDPEQIAAARCGRRTERTGMRDPSAGRRGLLFAAPALLWTLAFFLVPFLLMVGLSFRPPEGMAGTAPSLQNYVRFFTNETFLGALRNSIEVTAIVTVVSVILAYPACLRDRRTRSRAMAAPGASGRRPSVLDLLSSCVPTPGCWCWPRTASSTTHWSAWVSYPSRYSWPARASRP